MTKYQTPETHIENFPHPHVGKIEGLPTCQTLAEVLEFLAANAASVPSSQGGGNHGHLGHVIEEEPCLKLTGTETPFEKLATPDEIVPSAADACRQHQEKLTKCDELSLIHI